MVICIQRELLVLRKKIVDRYRPLDQGVKSRDRSLAFLFFRIFYPFLFQGMGQNGAARPPGDGRAAVRPRGSSEHSDRKAMRHASA